MAKKTRGTKANRTPSGKPSANARRMHGSKLPSNKGAFPIFDKESAKEAIDLRGHTDTKAERADVLRRAAEYLPKEAAAARIEDRKNGDI